MVNNYDFGGYATRNDLLCGDGRTIRKNAFINNDGQTVPLVWNHEHNNPDAVLGHAILENRSDGVYAYCTFNDTPQGRNAKELVQHGDVRSLSIWANQLKQIGKDVIHGVIRELSLVLAGANPGATIDFVMAHGEDGEDGLYANYDESALVIMHSADKKEADKAEEKGEQTVSKESNKPESEETLEDVFNTLSEKQKTAVYALIGAAVDEAKGETVKHSDDDDEGEVIEHADDNEDEDDDDEGETVGDVFNTLTEKQKTAVYALIGEAINANENKGGNATMKHNIFDQETGMNEDVLSHSEMMEIFDEAKRNGSLADTVLAHGIEDIEYLFPDAKKIDNVPGFIKRDTSWVGDVMGAVHKSPFSRIKSVFADITETEARAKGYVKGNEKTEELFSLLKRVTTPTTVYKKQKLDRDDVVDITDFDVIAWIKAEMRLMLDEEIARAILVGDGRSNSSQDKIVETSIRPIWTDEDTYTIKSGINVTADTTDDDKAKAFIKACIKSRKNYKGSGNPVMYMSEDMLTNCLLLEDVNGRIIYDSIEKLANRLRVRKIVTVPVMENLTRVVGSNTHELAGIYVNLQDYNVGADKGGAINMFDDFDIDYNQMKYLIETRCSGALIKPFAAVAIEFVTTNA